jgi:hypothetical protein
VSRCRHRWRNYVRYLVTPALLPAISGMSVAGQMDRSNIGEAVQSELHAESG